MTQEGVWDREYKKSKLLTKENKPQADVVRFAHFLKKEKKIELNNLRVLDLGSGMGRNSFYFAEFGANVSGFEISKTAISIAEENAKNSGLNIKYQKQSMGELFPLENNSIDIILDITSSNSLGDLEREVYLKETYRVLKNNGYFFVKALCKDGDENAKFLLKNYPGKEKDTYTMPELNVTERVWSKDDFIKLYEQYFNIINLEKKTSYSRMNNRVYKRNFWICYMKKVNK
jgi:SAM-dependent methyltransferase